MTNESLIAEHAALLARVDLFAGLARVTLAKLAAHLVPVRLASGDEVFRQGEPGDAFYLVARGEFGIYVVGGTDEGENRVAVLGTGDPVGEMALLTNSPRSATIRAETDGELLRLDRARFLSLMRQEPDVALAIAATLSRRLQGILARGEGWAADSKIETSRNVAQTTPSPTAAKLQRLRTPGGTLSVLLAGVILFSGWLAAPAEGLSTPGWHALVLLAAVVPMLAVEALPEGVLALLLPAAWVVAGVARPEVAPALRELVEALGYAPGSSAAAGLSMAALIGFGQMAAVFLTSSTTAVLVFAVLPAETRSGLDWIAWAYYAAPPHLILLAGFVGTILWWYRPQNGIAKVRSSLDLQRALLGPPSWRERISLAVGAALVIGFIGQPLHGVDPAWLSVLALTLLAATGVW
jgi:Cyclic nucleotide-binding domain